MKLFVANRDYPQEGFSLQFKVVFTCSVCKREVEPDRLAIGRGHVYALHCDVMQEVGCVA